MKYSLYLVSKFMCTLTHNSPRCSLLRNGAQTDCRNTSSALCYPWRSLRSPSQPKPRLSAQLTHHAASRRAAALLWPVWPARAWLAAARAAATQSPAACSFCCSANPSGARGRHAAERQHRTAPPLTYSSGDSLSVATDSSAPAVSSPQVAPTHRVTGPMHALA